MFCSVCLLDHKELTLHDITYILQIPGEKRIPKELCSKIMHCRHVLEDPVVGSCGTLKTSGLLRDSFP